MKNIARTKRILALMIAVCLLFSWCVNSLSLEYIWSSTEPTQKEPKLGYPDQLLILYNGNEVDSIVLSQDETKDLLAQTEKNKKYEFQWQVAIDENHETWVDILDETNETLTVRYALVKNVLNSYNEAYIRVCVPTEDGRCCSKPIGIHMVPDQDVSSEPKEEEFVNVQQLFTRPVCDAIEPVRIFAQDPLQLPAQNPSEEPAEGEGEEDEDYIDITIRYLSAEDPTREVWTAYTAHILSSATFGHYTPSPTEIGFAPYFTGSQGPVEPEANDQYTVTVAGETRSYTYTNDAWVNDDTDDEEDDDIWLAAISAAMIDDKASADASTVYVSYTPNVDPAEDIEYCVYYKAIDVNYSAEYYFQNINNDEYTKNANIYFTSTAKTGTIIDDQTLETPVCNYYGVDYGDDFGFSALYHYPESVAADGSTVFEMYYDRNYYIYKFDNNGGYGVDPIYARFGAAFVVVPPTRPGYSFEGWDEIDSYTYDIFVDINGTENRVGSTTLTAEEYLELGSPSAYTTSYTTPLGVTYRNAVYRFVNSYGDGVPDEGTGSSHTFSGTIEARTVAYKAIWSVTNANVSIIYWAENANDNGYTYWGNDTTYAESGSLITADQLKVYQSGNSFVTQTTHNKDLPSSLKTGDYTEYYYSHADSGITVNGDGSSVLNVYYRRNVYTLTLKDTVSCQVEAHTHTDDCYGYLCSQHVHDASCYGCGLTETPHTAECCSLLEHTHGSSCLHTCDKTEHTHTVACTICGKEEIPHTSACCSKPEHSEHTPACYGATSFTLEENITGDALTGLNNQIKPNFASPKEGYLYCYTKRTSTLGFRTYTYHYYLYYRLDDEGTMAWAYLGSNDGNSINNNPSNTIAGLTWSGNRSTNDNGHVESGTRNNFTCTKAIHTHGDGTCNVLGCTNSSHHIHTNACYECGLLEHEHDDLICCSLPEHTHSIACYGANTGYVQANGTHGGYTNSISTIANPVAGKIYKYGNGAGPARTFVNYFYDGHTWWYLGTGNEYRGLTFLGQNPGDNTYNASTNTLSTSCNISEHEHGKGQCNLNNCPNGGVEHHHTEACYSCGLEEHVHTAACYYKCGKEAHKHSASCCGIEEHSHSTSCYTITGTYSRNGTTGALHFNTTGITINSPAEATDGLYYESTAGTNQKYLCVLIGDQYHQIYYGNSTGNRITQNRLNNITGFSFSQTCGKVEHHHTDGNCVYACGLNEHTHTDACYYCGLEEHTHGDGKCNAVNCTNPNHHTHTEACITCGYTSTHVHTADCATGLICNKPEHNHSADNENTSAGSYGSGTYNVIKIIQAKYGADISGEWAFTTRDNYTYPKTGSNPTSWYPKGSSQFTERLAYICTMPNESFTLYHITTNNSTKNYNYYVECLPGETATTTYNGVGYKHYFASGTQTLDFNSWTRAEDFFDLEGFDQNVATKNGTVITGASSSLSSGNTVNMYYTRKEYDLDFINADGITVNSESVAYQVPISSYVDDYGTPSYPTTYEPDAYVFTGWYYSSTCAVGTEYVGNETMPAGNYALYAKWTPITHTVRFFETYAILTQYEDSVQAGSADESLVYVKPSQPSVSYTVYKEHGGYIGSIPNPDKLQVTNPGGSITEYDFGGWFYMLDGVKHAYTPLDMPINSDLNIFADWGSHSAQPFRVHYALNDVETLSAYVHLLPEPSATYLNVTQTVTGAETRTYICLEDPGETSGYGWHQLVGEDVSGYAYQGTTRTFQAKVGNPHNQLYSDFNDLYFPLVSSHSINVAFEEDNLNPTVNVYTFRYVHVNQVSYTVRYLSSENNTEMSSPKVVNTTSSIVTERFKTFSGYVPDAFYKQLILAVMEDPNNPGTYISSSSNVITFYYTENTTSARYTIHFMLQKGDQASATIQNADYNITFASDGNYTYSSKFEESASRIDGIADINASTNIVPIDFAGFDLITDKAYVYNTTNGTTWTGASSAYTSGHYTITIHQYGTDLFLFYRRESYPYKVYYLLYGSPVAADNLATYTTTTADPTHVLANTKTTGTALYGTSYTENAISIPGYTCVSNTSITKDITPQTSSNFIIFFYTKLQYTVQYQVWSGGGGTLDYTNDTFDSSQTPNGSTATASAGYEFAGWYVDSACTIPADYDAVLRPNGKGTTYNNKTDKTKQVDGAYVLPLISRIVASGQTGGNNNIFYAKFIPLTGQLTITRANASCESSGTQTFIYEVKNTTTNDVFYVTVTGNSSVTVSSVFCGSYTITQMNDWSHRHTDTAKSATINPSTTTTVTFNTAASNTKWLTGNSAVVKNVKG